MTKAKMALVGTRDEINELRALCALDEIGPDTVLIEHEDWSPIDRDEDFGDVAALMKPLRLPLAGDEVPF